jgi:hypothetical protein
MNQVVRCTLKIANETRRIMRAKIPNKITFENRPVISLEKRAKSE